MQAYSVEIPWVRVTPNPPGWAVECAACGAAVATPTRQGVDAFAVAHVAHQAPAGYFGIGDAIAAIAKPIARAFGKQPCTPCEARQRALNTLVRRPW